MGGSSPRAVPQHRTLDNLGIQLLLTSSRIKWRGLERAVSCGDESEFLGYSATHGDPRAKGVSTAMVVRNGD